MLAYDDDPPILSGHISRLLAFYRSLSPAQRRMSFTTLYPVRAKGRARTRYVLSLCVLRSMD